MNTNEFRHPKERLQNLSSRHKAEAICSVTCTERQARLCRGWRRRALLLCTVLYCTCYLGLTQVHSEDVDILQKLGLKGEKPSRSVPTGVIPFRSGIILNQRAHIEAPLRSVFPAGIWPKLALVLSVRSHRVNSAFLFTLLSGQKRLLLGLQLVPDSLVLHTGPNTSVSLPYEPHDGQWHQLAVGIDGQTVTLYASCGEQSVQADFGWDNEEGLAPELKGSFLLGRTSQQHASAHFEGAVCQFDLVPSAQAAHNYCRYIKKHCREADTFRPNLSPLLPILPGGKNISATASTPKRSGPEAARKSAGLSLAKSAAAAASAVRYVAPRQTIKPNPGTISTPLLVTVAPDTVQFGLVAPSPKRRTETVTAPLRTAAPPTKSPTSRPATPKVSTRKPSKPTTPKPTPQKAIAEKESKKKPAVPATASAKPQKTKPDSASVDRAASPKDPQPTTAKKPSPKPKVASTQTTLSKTRSTTVRNATSKPTLSEATSSKSMIAKTTSSMTSKPVSKHITKPTKQTKTANAPVTPRPTKPFYNTVTPPATDGFLSWEVPPTQFSLLAGPKGQKGDEGLPCAALTELFLSRDCQDLQGSQAYRARGVLGVPLVPMGTLADLVHLDSRGTKETPASHQGLRLKERRETWGLLALLECLDKQVERDRKVTLDRLDSLESLENKVQLEAQVPKVILAGRCSKSSAVTGFTRAYRTCGAKRHSEIPGVRVCALGLHRGSQHHAGFIGIPGLFGLPGPDGERGIPGEPGKRGKMGRPGFPGDFGERGPPGPDGEPGNMGAPGPSGVLGLIGDMGPVGEMGLPGPAGLKGVPGNPGEPGLKGDKGDIGIPGEQGETGFQGDKFLCAMLALDRASRGVQGYLASVGNQDHRESWEIKVLMVHLDHQALRVSLVTWDHREIMALKDLSFELKANASMLKISSVAGKTRGQRFTRATRDARLGVALRSISSVSREMRVQLGHQDQQDLRAEWGEKDFLGRLGQRELRVSPVSWEKLDPWEKEVWWVSLDLWERQGWQERRGTEGRWAFLDPLEKRDQRVILGCQVRLDLQDHQEEQDLLVQLGQPVPEDLKACGDNSHVFQGARGPDGPTGEMGLEGKKGLDGPPGKIGFPGSQGKIGETGETGPKGFPGIQGPSGPPGDKGIAGEPGPSGPPGTVGLLGEIGQKGPPGKVGEPGLPGEPGEKGAIGPAGNIGEQGLIGQRGGPGLEGEAGPAGPDGVKGEKGDMGQEGDKGEKGVTGLKGKEGLPGSPGLTGVRGSEGKPGKIGERGKPGLKGAKGHLGHLGETGPVGKTGPPGFVGPKGSRGTIGHVVKGLLVEWVNKGNLVFKVMRAIGDHRGPWGLQDQKVKSLALAPTRSVTLYSSDGEQGDDRKEEGPPGPPGLIGPPGDRGERGEPGDPGYKSNVLFYLSRVKLVLTENEEDSELLDNQASLDLEASKDPKGPKAIKARKAKRVCRDKKEPEDKRENMGMMGRQVFLVKLVHRVKLVSQDSQEVKGQLDQRVSEVFEDRVALQEKKASEVEWESRANRETEGPKGNLCVLAKYTLFANEKGDTGEPGFPGILGLFGPRGPPGDFGPKGIRGPKGPLGTMGRGGGAGSVGIIGPRGSVGPRGEKGNRGENGFQGPRGSPGPRGPPGLPGPPGVPLSFREDGLLFVDSATSRRTENKPVMDLPMLDQGAEIFKTLHYLSNLIQSLKNPLGTRENPARICRDLHSCEQKLNDGTYWIDPNLGCSSDTIEVSCNFSGGGQTCLKPITVTKPAVTVGRVQMNFLHLLSSEAVQHVIIHCLNVSVWRSAENQPVPQASVKFKAWTGEVFEVGGELEPDVMEDSCWVKDGRWHQTHFIFHSLDPTLLPVIDVYNLPKTSPSSHYHLEIGPVCFL
ncbi:unnamed protein product [Menidia menidia]|uniref:(Atlantic silverside) hypothetical protein n=1 Tax=Menidia menidia TaxID=238744 RepID=A0A8S4ALG1_9TELE|nr:unnamed protein product [Menidia menidia]